MDFIKLESSRNMLPSRMSRIPRNIVILLLLSVSLLMIIQIFMKKKKTFKLEYCDCYRTIYDFSSENLKFSNTTCSRDAFQRGPHQKVVSFVFYGKSNSEQHKNRKYFEGIKSNLDLIKELYGSSWTMRLYYDLDPADQQLMTQLCDLACADLQLDLCNVRSLPGTPVEDASSMFAMNWRFFPSLDPQVDILLSRDLDSPILQREVDAVTEWLESNLTFHVMRDHPDHGTVMLGGMWATRMEERNDANIRDKWIQSWNNILKDEENFASRLETSHDQNLLARHIWPWAKSVTLQHDSYLCDRYPGSVGFPSQRRNETANFVGGKSSIWKECPQKCRRKDHLEWKFC